MRGTQVLVTGLLLCLCLLQVEASFKFFVQAPNILYVNETTRIFLVKGFADRKYSSVTVTLENKDDNTINSSRSYMLRQVPKPVNIRVEERLLGHPDSEGKLYVRLRMECKKYRFNKNLLVLVSRRTGIVYIQTDKPVYTPHQTVNVRVFTLNKAKYPSDVPVRIDIINPDGVILQQQNMHTTMGLVNSTFHISDLPVFGEWTVNAYYGHKFLQQKKVTFTVMKYVLPNFGVSLLDVTDYIISSTPTVTGKVRARHSFAADVKGHVSVTLWVLRNKESIRVTKPTRQNLNNGEAVFSFDTSTITNFLKTSVWQLAHEEARLQVEAVVTEESSGLTEEAVDSDCMFSTDPYVISTAGIPWTVTPGFPFDFSIEITYPNGKVASNTYVTASLDRKSQKERTNGHGLAFFTFDVSYNVQGSVQLEVEVMDGTTQTALSRKGIAVPVNQMTDQIKVIQMPRTFEADEDTTLKVQFAGNISQRIYLTVMSGNKIEDVISTYKDRGMQEVTFRPNIRTRMAPEVRAVVWYVKDGGEVVTHSTQLKLKRGCEFETRVTPQMENGKTYKPPGSDVELTIQGPMRANIALLAVDTSVYFLNNKNRLTRDRMFDGFENEDLGCGVGGGLTAPEVFRLSGLAALSDASINMTPRTSEECASTPQTRNRRAVDNHPATTCGTQHCCTEGTTFAANIPDIRLRHINIDEKCRDKMLTLGSCNVTCKQQLFACCTRELVNRTLNLLPDSERTAHRVETKYSPAIKMYNGPVDVRSDFPESFLLKTINMGDGESLEETVTLPDSVTTWSLQTVSMATLWGMCVSKPQDLLVKKDLFMKVHFPYEAVLGEQIELLATVYNTITDADTDAHIRVDLIHTDELCYEKDYHSPRVSISSGESYTYKWTVSPKRLGDIELRLEMNSNRNSDSEHRILKVVPPGVHQSPHPVYLVLDPTHRMSYSNKERSFSYKVRTNPVEKKQTFQLDLEPPTEVVNGSHQLVLGLEGGVMAEVVDSYLHGVDQFVEEAEGNGEQTMARLATSVSTARYLLHTRLGSAMSSNTTDIINRGIQRMMPFRLKSGAFGMYQKEVGGTHPSLWLTASTTRMLSIARGFSAQMQNDPSDVICGAVQWMMAQNKENLFYDNRGLPHLWSLKGTDKKLALTAYVLLAIKESGCIQPQSDEDKHIRGALDNLGTKVRGITRPYTLAIITYTLAKARHSQARIAYRRLQALSTSVDGKIPAQRCWRQRPSWRSPEPEDVETTAYGVLAQLALGHPTHSGPYVRWLLSQRLPDGLFKTPQTTIMGLQALMEYSNSTTRTNINFICHLRSQAIRPTAQTYKISSGSVKRNIDVTAAVGGRLDVECQGDGIGQLTLKSSYYTEKGVGADRGFNITAVQGPKMTNDLFYGTQTFSNNTNTVRVCTRMRKPQDRCGHAVIDVGLGTGYKATRDSLEQVHRGQPDKINLYTTHSRSVRFYVPRVPHESELCISFDVQRHHVVKNVQPAAVSVYDYYEPDRLRNVIFYHPESEASLGKCGSCPKCYGYSSNEVAPLDYSGLKARANRNNYVFKGRWTNAGNGEGAVVFLIKQVGKRGSQAPSTIINSNVPFKLPEGCSQCSNLEQGNKYLIMGKEKTTPGTTGMQYVLDVDSYIIRLDAPRSQNETLSQLRDDQKRFCSELKLCHKKNGYKI